MALGAELAADVIATAALPDDGVVQGLAGVTIENQNGFALVGKAEGDDPFEFFAIAADDFTDDGEDIAPNLLGIVFYPSRLRVILFEFFLSNIDNISGMIEQNGS